MKRNWYVICTKYRREKKVATLLSKKGIENYCPLTNTERKSGSQKKKEINPLFSSYVFVYANENEIPFLKKIPYVTNMVYWKSKPIVVSSEEIDAIKLMEESYQDIQVHKTIVAPEKKMYVQKESITDFGGNILTIQHKGLIVTLPSLGYKISARVQRESSLIADRQAAFGERFPKILNPLYLFGF